MRDAAGVGLLIGVISTTPQPARGLARRMRRHTARTRSHWCRDGSNRERARNLAVLPGRMALAASAWLVRRRTKHQKLLPTTVTWQRRPE